MKKIFLLMALIGVAIMALGGTALAGDEYQEAMQQTEEEWQAVRNTMQQGKEKFEEFNKKYQEYEDAVFSQDPEKGIAMAKKLFNLSDSQTDAAKEKLGQLREMFNTLDKNGIKDKLKSAAEKLEFADKVAGEVENVWQFAKKFDPANAKDNPTYGLRLIGDLLKDGAGKMEKIPLVGQILGKWIAAYGEVAGDFANALDRLGKKIEDFRGGSLCGQLGYKTDQQKAFEAESHSGEDCLTYFAVGVFPRLYQSEVYQGNEGYFLFDTDTRRGYFSPTGTTDKVYNWHGLLLERRRLECDWLASRSNSLTGEVESRAREIYQAFSGWRYKSDPGWLIIDKLGLTDKAFEYGRLDEETFVANYILDEKHHNAIQDIWDEYDKHVILAGTVYEPKGDGTVASDGAKVELTVQGKTYSEDTDSDGHYEILMEGKINDGVRAKVSKDGFKTIEDQGRLPYRVTRPQNYTLRGEALTVVITGTVRVKKSKDDPAVPADGASIVASTSGEGSVGSTVTDGAGGYSLTIRTEKGVSVTVKASQKTVAGSTSLTVTSESHSGVDITMAEVSVDEQGGPEWTINVTVLDDTGKPVPGANVTGSGSIGEVATGAGGTAQVGPINVPADWEDNPFTVTFTPSVTTKDGQSVSGSSQAVTYKGESPSSVTLKLDVETAQQVTISGKVIDANGVAVTGAVVTGGSLSQTTGGSGSFSLGPIFMFKDSSITVNASFSDGTSSFAASPVTVTFDGKNTTIAGVTLTIPVEFELEVTISGRVMGQAGKFVPGVAISASGASATTDASGSYTLPPVKVTLGKPVAISASITVDGTPVSGGTTCTPTEATAKAPVITLDLTMEEVFQVTISGTVVDDQGAGVDGATVSAKSASTTSSGGAFTLGPFEMTKDQTASVSASYSEGEDQYSGGPTTVTFDGVNTDIGGVAIKLKKVGPLNVTVSGSVVSQAGNGIGGASVTSSSGQADVTGGSGSFTLGPIEIQPGGSITISASATDDSGQVASNSKTISPTSETESGVVIVLDFDEFTDDGLDSLIDSLEQAIDSLTNLPSLKAEFDLLIMDLEGIAADFNSNADFFMQRLRELREEACKNGEVSYSLTQARANKRAYTSRLDALYSVYAQITAAAGPEDAPIAAGVDGRFSRAVAQETTIEGRYGQMLAQYGVYNCDEDDAETESGDEAQDENPDDLTSQTPEECGNGLDDDGDGLIDECEDGCCDKNVQVTVDDCGSAADDIFGVSIDGGYAGVTPKGTSNTFNRELEPGTHTVTISCLDDGGDPLGTDVGTACISVVIYGQSYAIADASPSIDYGSSFTISFVVDEGPQVGSLNVSDGSSHKAAGLESD